MDFVDGGAGQQPLLLLVGQLLLYAVDILPTRGLGEGSIELLNVVGAQFLHLTIDHMEVVVVDLTPQCFGNGTVDLISVHDGREDILLTAYDLDSGFISICVEWLGELVASVVVEIGRVDIEDKLAVVGGIRLQPTGGNGAAGLHPGEQVSVAGGRLLEMDVPFGAVGKNVGVPIAVLFALIVLLGVANSLVRNGEISDACAVDAIVSCQRASPLSRGTV